ncbi:MAG: F0F1 ATP synthase subunit A [Clostridia bacterium]|nr:F0F1 ATP synthase subunit A [Clostridia bacterium]
MWKRIFLVLAIYAVITTLLSILYKGHKKEALQVEVFAPKTEIFGISISQSIVVFWVIMAVVIALAILFRLFAVPKFKDVPHGLQNAIEASIEYIDIFSKGKIHDCSDALASYMFTLAIVLMGSEAAELFAVRPPTVDLILTFSLSLITFFLINYYGIKKKGIKGRIKAMSSPTPFILPMKILSDVSIPVSLACRLFGNMLGGMIVMDLLRMALGSAGVGLPAVVGLYFNLFHPAIQTYIFITLSLTFISEATE